MKKIMIVVTRPSDTYLMTGVHLPQTYRGELIPNPSYVSDEEICLTTDAPKKDHFPFRVIKKSDIISMTEENGNIVSVSKPVERLNEKYQVKGSKGNEYTVTHTGSMWTCSCTGFQFRGACKHITEVKNRA